MQPLDGIRVLDFSTLVPGPLATLILAEAGAEVLKIERPGGDPLRQYAPRLDGVGLSFALLNRGKRSLEIDLKLPDASARLLPLVREAQVLVEQFRPGVMDRLGLGYERLRAINPALVYCSVSGYGQVGPRRNEAAHDINYQSDAGILDATRDGVGQPQIAPTLTADFAGGAYPAVINVLLALRVAERTGEGTHLDIAMTDHLFTFAYEALALSALGRAPKPGAERLTGGSARYRIYGTADGRFLALGALEDRFWLRFCTLIGLSPALVDDRADAAASADGVAAILRSRDSGFWLQRFAGEDVCCTLVRSAPEALADEHFQARGLFGHRLPVGSAECVALPVPVASQFRDPQPRPSPVLGEARALLEPGPG